MQKKLDENGMTSYMSHNENLRAQAKRVRTKVKNHGPRIKTYEDLTTLPERFKELVAGNPFLRLEEQCGDNNSERMLIFMADSGKSILEKSETWCGDGTFRCTPVPFKQVYILGGFVCGVMLPAIFALLPNLSALVYCPPGFVNDVYATFIVPFFYENNLNIVPEMLRFKDYFEKTYIGKAKKRGRGRFPGTFPLDFWNIYHEIMQGTAKTNNSLEQLNREINQNIKGTQTIYTIIEIFRNEVLYAESKHNELDNGTYKFRNPGRKNQILQKYVILKEVIQQFDFSNISQFIDNILPHIR